MIKRTGKMDRRTVLKNSALGLLGLSIPNVLTADIGQQSSLIYRSINSEVPKYWPNIDPDIILEVVGKSHSNLEGVKKLVDARPELTRSVWEWRFGDFESAIGAASHVGRRDIALYLMSKGARATIFTFAMLGSYDVVKSMIDFSPGIQKTSGPHGISLLDHAYAGERMKDKMSSKEIDNLKKTKEYLESIGNAGGEEYLSVELEEQSKYLGDYKYGSGESDGFSIRRNMRKLLSIGTIGGFGGALFKIDDNLFIYNGAPSVQLTFQLDKGIVKSLTVKDPNITVTAKKVS